MNNMCVLTVKSHASYSMQPDGCKLCLLTVSQFDVFEFWGLGKHLLIDFFFFFGVHPLRMTTTSTSTLKVGLAVAEEANA